MFSTHKAMSKELHNIAQFTDGNSTVVLNPIEIINTMIDLRIQLYELTEQIEQLQPAFKAACMGLNTEKISVPRAVITRRLTPGQWTYPPLILQQLELVKQLKQQFHQTHEPTSGREITWVIKLLLMNA